MSLELLKKENNKNILVTKGDIEEILHKYGIPNKVNNLSIYQNCFIHRSAKLSMHDKEVSNERFELLGDCILGCITGTYIFTRFEDQNEGFLTQLKIKIIRSKTLGMLGKKMGLGRFIILSQHVENENGRNNVRILEDLFESFIGALFLDNGGCAPLCPDWLVNVSELTQLSAEIESYEKDHVEMNKEALECYILMNKRHRELSRLVNVNKSTGFLICQRFIISVLETELDLVHMINTNDNYKDQLQHYFQRRYKGMFPEWKIEEIKGPTNNRIHTISISDDRGMIIGIGTAKKKIDAEQEASRIALIHLGIIPDNIIIAS